MVTCSCFGACFRKRPRLFPNRETSVVFVVGRIFPEANHTEGWVRLVLWALLSVKSREGRDSFQCLRIASGAESRLLLPLCWPALFPVRHSERVKRKIKRNWAYCLKVPTFRDWSPGAAILHSCEEWSDPIQGGHKDSIFWTERRHGSLRRIPSETRGGCALGGSAIWRGSKQSCSFTLNPQTMRFLISSSWGGWSQPWLVCRSGLRQEGSGCTDADWRDCEDHNCEHDFPKSRGCDSQRAYINSGKHIDNIVSGLKKAVRGLKLNPKGKHKLPKVICKFCP